MAISCMEMELEERMAILEAKIAAQERVNQAVLEWIREATSKITDSEDISYVDFALAKLNRAMGDWCP